MRKNERWASLDKGVLGVCLIILVQDGSAEMGSTYDSSIAKLNTEIERMAPNMKAMDR